MTNHLEEFINELAEMSNEKLIKKLVQIIAQVNTTGLCGILRKKIFHLSAEILRRMESKTNKTCVPFPATIQAELLSCGIDTEFLKG
ncbi:MAG: hypothetical protein HY219_02710 [Candidatus Staskawiczbacteria bacterium]|nr:hypothetical protein [Candidatus Staskawiczbacteria bacterium]